MKATSQRYPNKTIIYIVLVSFIICFGYLLYFFVIKNEEVDFAIKITSILLFLSALAICITLILWSELLYKEQLNTTRKFLNLRSMIEEMLSTDDYQSQIEILLNNIKQTLNLKNVDLKESEEGKEESQKQGYIIKETMQIGKKKLIIEIDPGQILSQEDKSNLANTIVLAEKIINETKSMHEKENELRRKNESNERYKELYRFISELQQKFVPELIYWDAALEAKKLFKANSSSIIEVKGTQDSWKFIAFKDVDNDSIKIVQDKINKGIVGDHIKAVKSSKLPNYINDVSDYPGWISASEIIQSWMGIPILIGDNVTAVINLDKDTKDAFTVEDLDLAKAFSVNISMVLYKNQLLDEMKNLSITDPLTGLYNRREFDERLINEINRVKREKAEIVVMEMDLDKFKQVNDRFGHPTGDKLLKKFANTLVESVRKADILFRIGGDEFAIILRGTDLRNAAQEIAKRIQKETLEIDLGIEFKPSVSIGIAQYEGEKILDFIEKVDAALYKAKYGDIKIVIG